MAAAWLGIYALSFATGLAVGVLTCLAWGGGTSAVAYWVRVFFGSLTAGIIAGGGALGGGGSPTLTDAGLQLTITKGTLMAAALVCLLAMCKDLQTYLKMPTRPNGPPPAPTPAPPVPPPGGGPR